jgi:aspartate/methionine/tyrosine aminotransferase
MLYEDSDINFYSPSMIDDCKERTILINGFSKSYAMTGWRIGVLTAPNYLIQKMGLLLESTLSCVPKFTQYAALEALKADQEEISAMVGEFRKRRDYIVNRLNKINGFSCVIPHGAFYAFPNITRTNLKSEELAGLLLEKLDIAVCPGTIFGSEGEGFLRFCYANSIENIEEAMNRIENFFGAKK